MHQEQLCSKKISKKIYKTLYISWAEKRYSWFSYSWITCIIWRKVNL